MNHRLGSPWLAGLTILLASGTLFAATQAEQRQGAAPKEKAAQAIAVSPANDTGALSRPQDRAATPLTVAECEGLGGKVGDVSQKSCPWTGKACFTADKNGVIRRACITMAPR